MNRAIYLGDFEEEGSRLLVSVSKEAASSEFIRTLIVQADPLQGDPSRFWTLSIETEDGRVVRALPFVGGFGTGPQRVGLLPEISVDRGAALVIRAIPSSPDTEALTGLSVIPEAATAGARTR